LFKRFTYYKPPGTAFCLQSGVQTVSYLRNFIGVKILLSPLASLFFTQSGANAGS